MDENSFETGPQMPQNTPPGTPGIPSLGRAMAVLAACLLLLMISAWLMVGCTYVQPLFSGRYKFLGALLLETLSVGLPLVLLFAFGRFDLRRSLGLHPAPVRSLAGALLIGAGLIAVAPQLEAWQSRLIPPPEGYLEGLNDLMSADSGASFAWAMLALAFAPAFLEEALFRGLLLRSALPRWGKWPSVILIGLLFGLFHLDLYRWPILALIGLMLTWIAVRSGSLWPAVIAHLANNGLAVWMVNLEDFGGQSWIDGVADVPPEFFAAGVLFIALGVWLVSTAGPGSRIEPEPPAG